MYITGLYYPPYSSVKPRMKHISLTQKWGLVLAIMHWFHEIQPHK